jgi:hypothetical protein
MLPFRYRQVPGRIPGGGSGSTSETVQQGGGNTI